MGKGAAFAVGIAIAAGVGAATDDWSTGIAVGAGIAVLLMIIGLGR